MGLFDKLKEQAGGLLESVQGNNKDSSSNAPSQQHESVTNNRLYDEQLENLIEMALTKGDLTEKDKRVLFKKAESLGVDLDEFEMVLDAKLYERKKQLQGDTSQMSSAVNKSSKYGDVKKCPSCGSMIESFTTRCSACGYEFRNIETVSSISELFKKLEEIDNQKGGGLLGIFKDWTITEKKVQIIKTFPIPNTKEDLLEFLTMAVPLGEKKSIFSASEDSETQSLRVAWREKCGQVIMKARFSMKDDPETLAEIEKYAKHLKIK